MHQIGFNTSLKISKLNRRSTAYDGINLPSMKGILQDLDIQSIKESSVASFAQSVYNMQPAEIKQVKQNLINTKLFLNMVVHDLRNPTVASKIAS